jgi:hypothetical protein
VSHVPFTGFAPSAASLWKDIFCGTQNFSPSLPQLSPPLDVPNYDVSGKFKILQWLQYPALGAA